MTHPQDDQIKELTAECAVYRQALDDIHSVSFGGSKNSKVFIFNRCSHVLGSLNAGASLLKRLDALERVVEAADRAYKANRWEIGLTRDCGTTTLNHLIRVLDALDGKDEVGK
jgi:hypothetical protein